MLYIVRLKANRKYQELMKGRRIKSLAECCENESFSKTVHFWKLRESSLKDVQANNIVQGKSAKASRPVAVLPEPEKTTLTMSEWEEEFRSKRNEVIQELLATEKGYLDNLQLLNRKYIQPLKANPASKGISRSQSQTIFSNIEIITSFHQKLLKEFQSSSNPTTVFLRYADFLKMYTHYVKSFENSLSVINSLSVSGNKLFRLFLSTTRNDEECGGQELTSFLIAPVQRIPRYEMFLAQILKLTFPSAESDNEEYKSAQDAYLKVREAALHVNESQRKFESLTKLVEIQNKLQNGKGFSVVDPDRMLVREREVVQVVSSSSFLSKAKTKRRVLFLFNDCILLTKEDYSFKLLLSLGGLTVELLSEELDGCLGCRVYSSKREVVFQCRSSEEAQEWKVVIEEQRDTFKAGRRRKWGSRSSVLVSPFS